MGRGINPFLSAVEQPNSSAHLQHRNRAQYHRITELLELDGTFKGHLFQFPYSEQEHAQLHQVLRARSSPAHGVYIHTITFLYPQGLGAPKRHREHRAIRAAQATSTALIDFLVPKSSWTGSFNTACFWIVKDFQG